MTVRNRDYNPPTSEEGNNAPVVPATHLDTIKMLWGPGQDTVSGFYQPPIPSKFRRDDLLNIPRVARFIYATKSSYNTDDYQDEEAVPELPYYEIVDIKNRQPPFIYDRMAYIKYVPSGAITGWFSIREYDTSTYPYTYVADQFYVGMKYRVPYFPSYTGALDYIINGISGPGFYARGVPGGYKVTPF